MESIAFLLSAYGMRLSATNAFARSVSVVFMVFMVFTLSKG